MRCIMVVMKQLKPHELQKWVDHGRDFLLLDVREQWEREANHMGGMHIPMGEIFRRMGEIPKDCDVVIYCEKGIRSLIVVQRLESFGYNNLHNLSGGIKAWQDSLWSPS